MLLQSVDLQTQILVIGRHSGVSEKARRGLCCSNTGTGNWLLMKTCDLNESKWRLRWVRQSTTIVTLSRSHAGHCQDSPHNSGPSNKRNPGSNTFPNGLSPSCRSRMHRQAEPSGCTLMWSTPPEHSTGGVVRLHDFQARSPILPDPRLQEFPFSLGVLVGVVRDRRIGIDVESQTVGAEHLGQAGTRCICSGQASCVTYERKLVAPLEITRNLSIVSRYSI